ncbi:MAG: dephospho-CoA kinase [Atopobiaceae bacterium]|nr:dephospho-CoA kinase [Atopobiaceae bacterium]
MYTVFLAGGTASGKSTVARELERLGAWRIDLDELSRAVLAPGEPCVAEVCAAFGDDLVDPETGALDRALLARRTFADDSSAALLEGIELPHIRAMLVRMLTSGICGQREPACCVVEVPLLDRVESMVDLADEVVVVACPLEVRRERARGRGMDVGDFDRRVALQPSDEYLRSHATTVIDNTGDEKDLVARVRAWWDAHGWA